MSWPLAQPIRTDDPGGNAPWRDNAFVSFWDQRQDVYGTLHVSTSPNASGRRARLSVAVQQTTREIVEPLDPGSFTSDSLAFDLAAGHMSASAHGVELDLTTRPRLSVADFGSKQVIPRMGATPVQHFQTTVDVAGRCHLDGHALQLDGRGVRDRTWGPRDESVNIAEYAWLFVAFDDFSVTVMRFLGGEGHDITDGFVLGEQASSRVDDMALTRDAAGLCAAAHLRLADGNALDLRSSGRRGGFWVPMSNERHGPTMSAYDEFAPFTTADGRCGFGLVEHGVVRKLY
jgi:hypothetical protein